jgi:predicted DNA binding protein
MKTIKQIADEIGVTKQAVSKRLSQLPPTEVSTASNGTKLISPNGEGILKDLIKPTTNQLPSTVIPTVDSVDTNVIKLLQDNMSLLQEQLAEKDRQIKDLSQQNKGLNETIKIQAQSINAERHNDLADTIQKQLTVTNGESSAELLPPSRWTRLVRAWKG